MYDFGEMVKGLVIVGVVMLLIGLAIVFFVGRCSRDYHYTVKVEKIETLAQKP